MKPKSAAPRSASSRRAAATRSRARRICPASSKGMVGSNYSDGVAGAGLTTPGKLLKQWDFTVRHRRTDHEGPPVVLRDGARRGTAPDDSEHLPQPECRRSRPSSCMRPIAPARCAAPRAGACTACALTIQATLTRQDQLPLGRTARLQRRHVHERAAMGAGSSRSPKRSIGPLGLGGLTLDDVARDRRLSAYATRACGC